MWQESIVDWRKILSRVSVVNFYPVWFCSLARIETFSHLILYHVSRMCWSCVIYHACVDPVSYITPVLILCHISHLCWACVTYHTCVDPVSYITLVLSLCHISHVCWSCVIYHACVDPVSHITHVLILSHVSHMCSATAEGFLSWVFLPSFRLFSIHLLYVGLVAVVAFKMNKLCYEHIKWFMHKC